MRTFVAIELPTAIQQRLAEISSQLRSFLSTQQAPDCLRWSPMHNAHLTLRFVGESTPMQVEALASKLSQIAESQPPYELSLGGVGGFPTLQQPRVLWLAVQGDLGRLQALQVAIERTVQQVGFTAEARAYFPHITLARAHRNADSSQLRQVGRLLQTSAASPAPASAWINAQEIVYLQSDIQRGGPRYTALGRYRLVG